MSVLNKPDKPNRGVIDATTEWRINSAAMKVNELFEAARIEARDELLWLSSVCREVVADANASRMVIENLQKKIEKLERRDDKD